VASFDSAPRDPALGDAVGGYRLERELGRGAMGVVFLAVAPSGERVALKLLREELSENDDFVRRFMREARVAAEVEHAHLVPVLEAGEDGGRHFLAVEFVAGGTLRRRLDADGPLGLDELRRLSRHVGTALDALHAAELVHRDVKPENVMLDESGSALLVDYGLAKGPAYTVLTKPGQVMGTPAYLAPELVDGGEASPASDLYALGCVLHEAVSGRPPFVGGNVFELLMAHVTREPPDPCADRDDLPAEVGRVLAHALAKEPGARPTTGRMLAQMLAAAK
jgi:serine/threonine-protein kinase